MSEHRESSSASPRVQEGLVLDSHLLEAIDKTEAVASILRLHGESGVPAARQLLDSVRDLLA